MSLARSRRRGAETNYWPGFVDAMATLLLVVTFLLSVFMVVQFIVTHIASGKDTALQQLNQQVAQLTEMLAMERSTKRSLQDELASLQVTLEEEKAESTRLQGLVGQEEAQAESASERAQALSSDLEEQKEISSQAQARIDMLNQQLAALRRQIGALEEALATSESRAEESRAKIADLGKRLNVALARKVQELSRYRSDFFGRLRTILGERENVRIEGDRFVFQAEVLFPTGSDAMNPQGIEQIDKVAGALKQLNTEIPEDIDWALRVDGHTDRRPIQTSEFNSNWELSAARAITVVQRLIAQGVPPEHLVAAGFGEYQPLDPGETEQAYRQNRRIELKLTEK